MSGQLSWVGPYLLPEPQADPSNAATASALYNQIMALDAASQARLALLMKDPLAAGGLIVAATHGDLGLAARELRLGGAP